MYFDVLWTTVRSLRFRLAAWNALGVALVGVVALWAVREGVRVALYREIDAVLQDDLREIELLLRDTRHTDEQRREELLRKSEGHIHHSWFVQLLNESQEEIWSTNSRPSDLRRIGATIRIEPTTRDGFRLSARTVETAGGRKVVVRVGSSLKFVEENLARIDRTALVAAAVLLVGSPLAGFLLAGRATRPLNDVISTAKRIRPERMDERLPLRGTGDELDILSRTINDLLNRLAVYLDHHRQFVANVAHELRSPLAAMKNAAEVSLVKRRTVDEYETLIQENIEEIDSLTYLVNQLLMLAECETNRLMIHGEPTAFDEIVQKAADMFQAMAETRDVRLSLAASEPAMVEGNPRHLRLLVNNLLDNAIKFTPSGGAVEVRVYVHRGKPPNEQEAVLEVVDTGQGIPREALPRIFERFYRADPARGRVEGVPGTGLGLSICQSIVTALGGAIEAESQPGRGTRMTVRLPGTRVTAPAAVG